MVRARTLTLNTRVNVTGADKLKGLGDQLSRLGQKLTIGVTLPLGLLAGAATKAASDLNESINAINVVFGEAAEGVLAIGQNADKSMGLSQRAFNQAATSFSSFAQGVAGEGGDVAGVIETITQRAADFASVHNLQVADALDVFRSGLAGETEPLRRFGIDLSAASVAAHALAVGISDGNGPLTEAQKIQARYSLLLERTAVVSGDFANTSTDAANAQRILAAEIENAGARLGEKFLPIQLKVMQALGGLIDAWEKLPGPIQDAVVVFGAFAAAAGPVLFIGGKLIALGGLMVKAFGLMRLAILNIPTALGYMDLAIAKSRAAVGLLRGSLLGVLGPIALVAAALNAAAEADLPGARFLEGGVLPGILQKLTALRRAVEDSGGSFEVFGERLRAVADRLGISFEEALDRVTLAVSETGVTYDQALSQIEQSTHMFTDAQEEMLDKSTAAWEQMQGIYSDSAAGIANLITNEKGAIGTAAQEALVDPMVAALLGGKEELERIAGETPGGIAQALLDAQFEVEDAAAELARVAEEALHPMIERAQIIAFLSSAELAQGLTSGLPAVREAAKALKAEAEARLVELEGAAFQSGLNTANTYAAGMRAGLGVVIDAARQLASSARRQIAIESEPPDPASPLRGITKWGENLARTFAEGIVAGQGEVSRAFGQMFALPQMAALGGGTPGAAALAPRVTGSPGEYHTHYHLTVTGSVDEPGLRRLLQRVASPWER